VDSLFISFCLTGFLFSSIGCLLLSALLWIVVSDKREKEGRAPLPRVSLPKAFAKKDSKRKVLVNDDETLWLREQEEKRRPPV
jgi:hypothetical protein